MGLLIRIFLLTCLLASCHKPIQLIDSVSDTTSELVGSNRHFSIVRAGKNESYENLAARYTGGRVDSWIVAEANDNGTIRPGSFVVIPRRHDNTIGVYKEGHQVVPILSYHRIDSKKNRMSVSPSTFKKHLTYLSSNNYHVVTLDDVESFLQGNKPLPLRSVVITIDDGYSSAYRNAFPLLREFGFSATVFVYTDFIGKGGLTWKQLEEMRNSGLIDIQPHSKSHANLVKRASNESEDQYQQRIHDEINIPRLLLEEHFETAADSFAYPYGATNKFVVDSLKQAHYQLGLTVHRGSNAFYSYPFALKRSMIFGDASMSQFIESLQFFSPKGAYRSPPKPTRNALESRLKLAEKYEQKGDLARALRERRIIDASVGNFRSRRSVWKLERRISKRARFLTRKGRALLDAGKITEARTTLLDALQLNPKKRDALNLLRLTVSQKQYAALAD